MAEPGRHRWVPETHKIFCAEALGTLIAELRELELPFEVTVSPISLPATQAQCFLWQCWMRELERALGVNRDELETGFLIAFGKRVEMIGKHGPEWRYKSFPELHMHDASAAMSEVQVLAASKGIMLKSSNET